MQCPTFARRARHRSRSPGLILDLDFSGPRQTFPGDTGDVADLCRNNPAGIRNGAMAWSSGPFGPDLAATTTTSFLDLGLSEVFDFTTAPFSFAVLAAMPASLANWSPVARGVNGAGGWWLFLSSTGQIQFVTNSPTVTVLTTSAGAWTAGSTTHIAVSRAGASAVIYVNGAKVTTTGSVAGTIATYSPHHLWLNHYDSSSFGLASAFMSFKVWNRSISAADVAAEYADPFAEFRSRSHY